MSHLTPETIARLVDEEPNASEAAHLELCAECRAELDGMRDDVQALSLLPDMEPAPDAWPALERRLAGEGLIRRRPLLSPARLSYAAAAMVVFLAGGVAGRMSAPQHFATVTAPADDVRPGPGVGPGGAQQDGTPPVDVQRSPSGRYAGGGDAAGAADLDAAYVAGGADAGAGAGAAGGAARGALPRMAGEALPGVGQPLSRPAGSTRLASAPAGAPALPRTLDDAAAVLRQAEEFYLAALTRYAELAAGAEAGDPVSRLAALQSIVMTTQAALAQAPADPVINGYHLTALAQRDATLRQVASATSDRWY
jgi:hypothetical protein